MARLKLIPLSRAKTAYGLVQEVKRAILAEPKRANMRVFVDKTLPEHGGPHCGTVGCFAGWVCLLRGQYQSMDAASPAKEILTGREDFFNSDVSFILEPRHGSEGFSVFNSGYGDACETTFPGTRAHARAVIARINRFLKKNATELKRVKLAPVTERQFTVTEVNAE